MDTFQCEFCGRKFKSNGILARHIKRCFKNPSAELSKTAKIKAEREHRRRPDGSLERLPFSHSEKSRKKISEARKKWLAENKDKHVWRRNSKFVSVPCERLKSFLREKHIEFVEEYEPFEDFSFCIDIAWPDIKVGIEVNGNQHYNKNGELKKYYADRHALFESRGWKIFEIHYTKCYNINITDIKDILKLPIYDKNYVGKYFSRKEKRLNRIASARKEKQLDRIKRAEEVAEMYNSHRSVLINMVEQSGIDFSKHWNKDAKSYLIARGELFDCNLFRAFKKYYPEFLKNQSVYKRKGSKF